MCCESRLHINWQQLWQLHRQVSSVKLLQVFSYYFHASATQLCDLFVEAFVSLLVYCFPISW